MKTTYSVIGLGKLGASMSAAIAQRGFHVIGVDINQRAVDLVNAGHAPVQETDLEAIIAANTQRLHATVNYRGAILNSDVSFVIVPTPSDGRGAFSLHYAALAFSEIGKALRQKEGYHTVVLTSTVLPGATRYGLLPVLEQASGKVCGKDFGLCYSPEFIALGNVIHDFLNPDFTLVGEFDERSGSLLEACYVAIMENTPPCQRMSIENAELTKISVNAFVTTKITFANMLATLCEHIPGGDVDVVTQALGSDRRIGSKYLTGGLGYGGPCFPRDNMALNFVAHALGQRADIAEVTDRLNRTIPESILDRLKPDLYPGVLVAILGLAYKPHSHVLEESQGVMLAQLFADAGAHVVAYDPLVATCAHDEIAKYATLANSASACLRGAEIVVITTPDPQFQALTLTDFEESGTVAVVVDTWRILDHVLGKHHTIRYFPIGRSWNDAANAARLQQLWLES